MNTRIIYIEDDFDLKKICESGQCFRASEEGGWFRFLTRGHILWIRPRDDAGRCGDPDETGGPAAFEVSCDGAEWDEIWAPYFDLGRDYRSIRAAVPEDDMFMRRASSCGRGIRILRQDPFETTISFIISQRKNIPAIRQAVGLLASRYGRKVRTGDVTAELFPEPEVLARVPEKEYREACRLGYRAPYVLCAAQMVAQGQIDLEAASELPDGELIAYFQRIRGVGVKVARCIALFAYGRTGVVPVDTWIGRVMKEQYGGGDPFRRYRENAGIFQQYAFYYAQHERGLR